MSDNDSGLAQDEPIVDEEMVESSADEPVQEQEHIESQVQELTIDNIEDDTKNATFTFYNEDHTLGNVSDLSGNSFHFGTLGAQKHPDKDKECGVLWVHSSSPKRAFHESESSVT